MKKIILLISSFYPFYASVGQKIAVAAEKLNILYIGVDNPLTIAAENTSFESLMVKATYGVIKKVDGKYIYRIDSLVVPVDIIVYKKVRNKLQELGRTQFRIKRMDPPELKLGNIGSSAYVDQLLNIDSIYTKYLHLNSYMPIEQFTIETISCDTGREIVKTFYGNKFTDDVKDIFRLLKHGDVLLISGIITLFNEKGIEVQGRRILIK